MNKATFAAGALFLALTIGETVAVPLSQAASPPGKESTASTATTAPVAAAAIGAPAPDFSLPDTNGQQHSLSQYKGKLVVLEWNNPNCPFVKKHYESGNMQSLQERYTKKGVVWLTINSSAQGKDGNFTGQELNKIRDTHHSHETAYLIDESGKVGREFGAKATPHMFVVDEAGKLIYAGAIDDKNTADAADIKTATNYVAAALDAAMANKPVAVSSTKAYGCRVHYQ